MSQWTRREFVRGAAGLVALPGWLPQTGDARFAYVASADNVIHAFRIQDTKWKAIQQSESIAPAAIAVSGNMLYAANNVSRYDRLPRASVECFAVGQDGHLSLVERVGLSLSATHARSLAISPDGKLLAVASYAEGIHNLFSIFDDGRLVRSGIFKELGCAHPYLLRFNSAGTRLFSYDAERTQPAVFSVESGKLARAEASCPAPAEEGFIRIANGSIYYNTVKVADVPAAKSVAIRT